jgi:hypothetical protein
VERPFQPRFSNGVLSVVTDWHCIQYVINDWGNVLIIFICNLLLGLGAMLPEVLLTTCNTNSLTFSTCTASSGIRLQTYKLSGRYDLHDTSVFPYKAFIDTDVSSVPTVHNGNLTN